MQSSLFLLNQVILCLWKQSSRCVPMKTCSEKYASYLQQKTHGKGWLIKITVQYGCYPVNLLHISQNTFIRTHLENLLLCLGLAQHLTDFFSNSTKSSKQNCYSKIFSITIFLNFCCEKVFAKLILIFSTCMLISFKKVSSSH